MRYVYEPFVVRRFAEDRIFVVNPKMPFEMFVNCFYVEHPFFLISWLNDRRIALTPNPAVIPLSLFQTGYWPSDLFPTKWEYVTIKNGTYPVIITTYPVANFDEWCRLFEENVTCFATETLADYITAPKEFLPIEYESQEKLHKPLAKEALKA
jgi:hypothetical protein